MVCFFSFGTPFLISNKRLPVYNISKIASVPSTVSSYLWPVNETDFDVTSGGKVYVAVEDSAGCLGTPGTSLIEPPIEALASIQRSSRVSLWIIHEYTGGSKRSDVELRIHVGFSVVRLGRPGWCLNADINDDLQFFVRAESKVVQAYMAISSNPTVNRYNTIKT